MIDINQVSDVVKSCRSAIDIVYRAPSAELSISEVILPNSDLSVVLDSYEVASASLTVSPVSDLDDTFWIDSNASAVGSVCYTGPLSEVLFAIQNAVFVFVVTKL